MDKWIKENKITTAIVVVLVVAFGVGWFEKLPKTEKSAEVPMSVFEDLGFKADKTAPTESSKGLNISEKSPAFSQASKIICSDDTQLIDEKNKVADLQKRLNSEVEAYVYLKKNYDQVVANYQSTSNALLNYEKATLNSMSTNNYRGSINCTSQSTGGATYTTCN